VNLELSRPTRAVQRDSSRDDVAVTTARPINTRGSTTDDVTDALREAVLDGTFPPSTWLREADLATSLNVSRTPVREALRRLADEELLERSANRGCRVREMTLDDVLALYVVRESLESLASRTAAARTPEGLVESLRTLQAQMVNESDPSALARLNLEFHRSVRNASGNAYLERFLTQVEHAVRRMGQSSFEDPERVSASHVEHEAIISAIDAGDGAAAEHAAGQHMRNAREARVQQLMRTYDRP
jgi:DNA-binding GntR family transcriptional regulator